MIFGHIYAKLDSTTVSGEKVITSNPSFKTDAVDLNSICHFKVAQGDFVLTRSSRLRHPNFSTQKSCNVLSENCKQKGCNHFIPKGMRAIKDLSLVSPTFSRVCVLLSSFDSPLSVWTMSACPTPEFHLDK